MSHFFRNGRDYLIAHAQRDKTRCGANEEPVPVLVRECTTTPTCCCAYCGRFYRRRGTLYLWLSRFNPLTTRDTPQSTFAPRARHPKSRRWHGWEKKTNEYNEPDSYERNDIIDDESTIWSAIAAFFFFFDTALLEVAPSHASTHLHLLAPLTSSKKQHRRQRCEPNDKSKKINNNKEKAENWEGPKMKSGNEQ